MELEIEYWVDEDARDFGLGEMYLGNIIDIEDGKRIVDSIVDITGYASAELLLDGEVIYGRDEYSTWGEEK